MQFSVQLLQDAIRTVTANKLGVKYEYLAKKWTGDYNPEKHLFEWKVSKDPIDAVGNRIATFHPVWFFDKDMWQKVGDAYCEWFQILNTEKRCEFWKHVFLLCQYTPEFWSPENISPSGFADWLIHKLDLQTVDVSKLCVCPQGGKREIVPPSKN
jgi:hypothetical protein